MLYSKIVAIAAIAATTVSALPVANGISLDLGDYLKVVEGASGVSINGTAIRINFAKRKLPFIPFYALEPPPDDDGSTPSTTTTSAIVSPTPAPGRYVDLGTVQNEY